MKVHDVYKEEARYLIENINGKQRFYKKLSIELQRINFFPKIGKQIHT